MADESVTKAVEFDHAPAYPCGLFQVNSGVAASFAISKAQCVVDFLRMRMTEAVQTGLDPEEAYVHRLLLDMVDALYKSTGAEV